MAVKIGEAFVDLFVKLDKYESQLKKAEKRLKQLENNSKRSNKGISSSFEKLGMSVAKAFVVFQGLRFVYDDLIMAASDMEETNNKFAVTFSEVSEEAEAMSKTLVESYGLSTLESKTLLSNTGDLLGGFGATGKQALDLSSKVQTLAVDLASFTNVEGGAQRASEALTAGLLGEREQLKALGIVIREADVQARLAAEGKANLTGEAKLLATAEATLEIATEQSKNAINDFSRSADSFANRSRMLESLMKDLAVTIGTPLKDALNDGAGFFLENREAILALGKALAEATKTVARMVSMIVDFISRALSPLAKLFEEAGGSANILETAIEGINKFLTEMEPVLSLIADAIAFLIEGIIELVKVLDELLGPALRGAIDVLGDFKDAVVEAVDELRGIEHEYVTIEKLADSSSSAIVKAENRRKKSAQAASEAWKKARKEAQEFVKSMLQAIESPAEKITRQQEENLAKLDNFRKRRLITEQQYADAKVAINEQAERQITELQRQQMMERVTMAQDSISMASDLLGSIGEAFNVDTQNRLMEIEQRKERRLDELNSTFEKEKEQILLTTKNKKKADKAIQKLEEEKAKKEAEINDKADKQAAKIQRRAFERQKAFRIIETLMSTGQAIMTAMTTMGPPASFIFAGLTAAMGAIQIATIASQKPPALADGGIAVGETIAKIGEEGTEAVFPLEGVRGKKTRQMFADNLINAIGTEQEKLSNEGLGTIAEEPQVTYNLHLNVGNDRLFGQITQGISNREIIIDDRALGRV